MIDNLRYLKGSSVIGPHIAKFDAEARDWAMLVFQPEQPVLEGELNLLQQAANLRMRDLLRGLYPSGGVLREYNPSATGNPNEVRVHTENKKFYAILDGIMKPSYGYDDPQSGAFTQGGNRIKLPEWTGGVYNEVVYLEVWFAEVMAPTGGTGVDSNANPVDASTVVNEFGMVANRTLNNDIAVAGVPLVETTRRVQLRGQLRVHKGADINGLNARASTAYGYSKETGRNYYVAGDGTTTSGDSLDTVDGYAYAIPLFNITRRAAIVANEDIEVIAPILLAPGDLAMDISDLWGRLIALEGRVDVNDGLISTNTTNIGTLVDDLGQEIQDRIALGGVVATLRNDFDNHRHPNVTHSADGFMSKEDKVTFDSHVGARGPTVHASATPSTPGFMPAADKAKLDGMVVSDIQSGNTIAKRSSGGHLRANAAVAANDVIIKSTFDDLVNSLSNYAPANHNHDGRYYTQSQIDDMLQGISGAAHNHDDRYYTKAEVTSYLSNKADLNHTHPLATTSAPGFMSTGDKGALVNATHNATAGMIMKRNSSGQATVSTPQSSTDLIRLQELTNHANSSDHDSRYYTKSQVVSLLNGKANTYHTHDWSQIYGRPTTFQPTAHTHDASDITSGYLSALRLPPDGILTRDFVLRSIYVSPPSNRGMYAFLRNNSGSAVEFDQTITGLQLAPADGDGNRSQITWISSGTWRCQGYAPPNKSTLWLRV